MYCLKKPESQSVEPIKHCTLTKRSPTYLRASLPVEAKYHLLSPSGDPRILTLHLNREATSPHNYDPAISLTNLYFSSQQKTKMSRHRDWDIACKVYIGNLGNNASKYEIEDAFGKYGPLRNVWVARNPPGFAFVEFEDARDAEDSVRGLDGTRVCGVSEFPFPGLAETFGPLPH